MSEAEKRFCWRCLFLALIPLVLLGGLALWATGQFQVATGEAPPDTDAMIEEIADLSEQNTLLQADLERVETALANAQSQTLAPTTWTFDDVAERALALSEDDQELLGGRLGFTGGPVDADGLWARFSELSAAEQSRFWDGLRASPAFVAWLNGVAPDDRTAWFGLEPAGETSTGPETVVIEGLGRVDGPSATARFMGLRRDLDGVRAQLAEMEAERDRLQAALVRLNNATEQDRDAALQSADDVEALTRARDDLAARLNVAQTTLVDLRSELTAAETARDAFASDVGTLQEELDAMRDSALEAAATGDADQAELDRLRTDVTRLGQERDAAVSALEETQARLNLSQTALDDAAALRRDLGVLEERVRALQESRDAAQLDARGARDELATVQASLGEAQAELAQTRAAAAEAGEARASLSQRLRNLLLGDDESGADADQGPLQLSSNVAFESGAATLSPAGRKALDEIARELIDELSARPNEGWRLIVEGHTDSRPISTKQFPSNWELSAFRAAAVARYLADRGVPEGRIHAVGRAEFDPISVAETAEAFARNRRIEFIIAPE